MSATVETLATTCKNCDVTFDGKFCPNCSQKASTHRFTLGHFIHEFLHAFTHTDKGILFLIKEMFFHPGKVALEYNAGKRKKYFNPITFLLIMTAIQVYTTSKTGLFTQYAESLQTLMEQMVGNAGGSAVDLQEVDRQMDEADRTMMMVSENNKLLTMLFIPVLSFLTWLFFRRSGHNYAENLVFNVLINGQLMVFFLIFSVIPFLIKPSLVIFWLLLYFLLNWIYSFIAYRQFFKQGWGITIFKGLVVQVIYLVLVQNITALLLGFLKK
ncbi:DUF3667 domain-containing protein [Fulvivirgaceae bacterium PWU4]|uniref:DUF3667 domain-containing protein n=1 Tax=Chryseosolibacter histidini TaxID=2782349 RepID=A0AAP2DV03_9BACT|nr:DUF3667 domain-containing protein [Chryseosolibacter histidini]MBT1701487.1 DUF3667 domain-containing protein [Chryseosolibacter histidini]